MAEEPELIERACQAVTARRLCREPAEALQRCLRDSGGQLPHCQNERVRFEACAGEAMPQVVRLLTLTAIQQCPSEVSAFNRCVDEHGGGSRGQELCEALDVRLEVGGNRSVTDWEGVLAAVLEKSRFVGMAVPGPDGKEVWLAEANPNAPVSLALPAQHGWAPDAWPYGPEHFTRMDESTDTLMYSEPRLVNHLDEASLARLTEVYRSAFKLVTPSFSVLDLCSSWTSHFPEEQVSRARVVVHGLNKMELDANKQATERHVQDLNADPRLPWPDGSFDFVTLALSVQYLTDPRAVFSEMHRVLRPGGMALVAFSHRCFIEKCVHEWVKEINDGEGHAHLICRYFQHGPRGGWVQLSSADVSPRHGDPLWVVTAVKAGQEL